MRNAVGKERAVGEAGDRVVEGLVGELVLEGLPLTDVAAIEHEAPDMLVLQQIGVLDFELKPTPVAMSKRALNADRLRAFGAPVENLRETRTVAVGEQPVEAAPFGLLHRVAEDSLDRRTLIVDDPVRVENGDHVARVRDQRPETCLALLAMQVLRQGRAFESE